MNNITSLNKRSFADVTPHPSKVVKKDPDLQLHENLLAGKGEEVVRYLQSIAPNRVKHLLVRGPQKKSLETTFLETVIKQLLDNANSWEIVCNNPIFFITQENVRYDLTQLLSKADFNQMTFSDEHMIKFEQFLYPNGLPKRHYPKITAGPISQLTEIEERSLYLYTTFDFQFSNFIAGGKLDMVLAADPSGTPQAISHRIKKHLVKVALQVATLNKLPVNTDTHQYLYRGEYQNLPPETLQERINAVQEGGKVTQVKTLMSTAAGEPAGAYTNRTIFTLYENVKGKDISPVSDFPGECECLLPPTQVQWLLHHAYEIDGITRHLFVARPVTVPVEKSTLSSPFVLK